MKVKELKQLLDSYSDDMEVVVCVPEYWEGETSHVPPSPEVVFDRLVL